MHNKGFRICHKIFYWRLNQEGLNGWGTFRGNEMHTEFWCGKPPTRPRNRREDNIKTDLQEIGSDAWTEFIRLRMGTSGGQM